LADLNNEGSVDVIESLPEEEIRVCLFSIGEDAYAIPVELLAEIIIPQKVFPVPTTPSHVLGVINLRGNIVPIVDMRPALSLPQSSAAGQIAIIKYGALTIGIVVDNVSEVVGVPKTSVQAIPMDPGSQVNSTRSRFITGIIQRETSVAALLNIERILDEIKLT
jgi:purine-binding chemotaxis protein CheW